MASLLDIDTQHMQRAIHLAMRGRGDVEPNPMVGCVIVKERRVIGEGWHKENGGPHAEPNALAACSESPTGATAFVTLEPCCHTNKRTPPCVPKLIEAKIARVVIGCGDPNPGVAGKGMDQLRAAGIRVDCGICEQEAKQLAAPFLLRMSGSTARPYVTLKWAETADGKIAGPGGSRLQISNARSSYAVHQLRAKCDAILVGARTVLADDPLLTPRGVVRARPLLRIVLDAHLQTPDSSKLVQTAREHPVRIYCAATSIHSETADRLRSHGVELRDLNLDQHGGLSIAQLLADLSPNQFTHLLVEPGARLAKSFLDEGWVDRVWVIRSTMRLGNTTAPHAAGIPKSYVETRTTEFDGDRLTEYLNSQSPAFFAPSPSADIVGTT